LLHTGVLDVAAAQCIGTKQAAAEEHGAGRTKTGVRFPVGGSASPALNQNADLALVLSSVRGFRAVNCNLLSDPNHSSRFVVYRWNTRRGDAGKMTTTGMVTCECPTKIRRTSSQVLIVATGS
jgi:hypothetical protein